MSEALIPLILGFVALGVAGEALLRGAVTVASALRVPPLIIGLTIIAFGTSAPELTVSIDAALLGQPDISLGNVIGSNIANILLVLGMMAAVRPFTVDNSTLARDGAVMLAVSVLLVVLGYIGLISRVLGGILLVMLAAYTVWLYRASRSQLDSDETDAEVAENNLPGGLPVGVPVLLLGLVGIVWGADKMVTGAILMAQHFGISEAIIGLSIVAIGTSLPELAVSLVASLRGHAGLAVGNIIGSNISNILLILGSTALVAPLPFAGMLAARDVLMMLAVALLGFYFMSSGRRMSRGEGLACLALYGGYLTYIFAV